MKHKMNDNFITDIINDDIKNNIYDGRVHTRFPPEPNGYLHIGHAKAIILNIAIAQRYSGEFNLRFDDTNPVKEGAEFVQAIIKDVEWLSRGKINRIVYASDYFEQMYQYAIQLIEQGQAYVDDQTVDEIQKSRGSLTQAGIDSPYRNRSIEENLDLFKKMRNGDFENGMRVLRAKVDMKSSNMNMRDPVMYRILHASHHRQKDLWCIYPMYDWAHGLEDSIENITHSLCSLEFEDHRPLYDWFLEKLSIYHPKQIEFSRLNMNYTIMSKRKLKLIVDQKFVKGWDDPRMPTISGLRRRGYTVNALWDFANRISIAKRENVIEMSLLEHCAREDLNQCAQRVMAVLNPIKVLITNYPKNQDELLEADNNPEKESDGKRLIPFSSELWIDRSDFMENPPKKYFRLAPNTEVRLKHAYYITCTNIIKDENEKIQEIHCTYDPLSKGGWTDDGRKVRGTIQWVSASHAIGAQVNLYDKLFTLENPENHDDDSDMQSIINKDSLTILKDCKIEPSLKEASYDKHYQFLRTGYFYLDSNSNSNNLVFNQTVGLRDSWNKKK